MRPAETFWRSHHGDFWLARYAESTFNPSRQPLGAALRAAAPYHTALDLGCNCGVLVPWLETHGTEVAITGVDVNHQAVAYAKKIWTKHEWVEASIVDWLPLQLGQWDLVVSSSCLAHLAPNDVAAALVGITTVAAHTIVLQEVTVSPEFEREGPSSSGVSEWRYDYVQRLARLGWECLSHYPQQSEPGRPAAVMTFRKAN